MRKLLVCWVVLAGLAACTPQNNDILPTLIPTIQPVVTQEQATPPPTNTLSARPTLPPTWTPSVVPTETALGPTETPVPVFTAIPTLVACAPFDVDREKSASTFIVGTPTQVFWTPVQGASRYRISIINGFNQEVFFDYAIDATYTFKADQFEAGQRYAWRVYPEDSLLRQMCLAVTGDMSPG